MLNDALYKGSVNSQPENVRQYLKKSQLKISYPNHLTAVTIKRKKKKKLEQVMRSGDQRI